ncbi:hypothetical protein BJX61DRAFT_546861 [Aspergillus egyptiacus]|nr:hypothetical protein BJX61DRAFT_546861 [Aspergillus egyptiacus]
MCGIPRPSTGHRIAIMFSSPDPAGTSSGSPTPLPPVQSYTLFFREANSQTKAVFRINDTRTINAFCTCRGIDLRIERHGDLTVSSSSSGLFTSGKMQQPLYRFELLPPLSSSSGGSFGEMEFDLPERLDLGVSECGIVGRKVTVAAMGAAGEVIQMGNGIVGYD